MKFWANKRMIKEEKCQAVESIGTFLRSPFRRCVLPCPDVISTCLAKLAFNMAAKQILITELWLLPSRGFYWADIIACSVEADACTKICTFLNFGVKTLDAFKLRFKERGNKLPLLRPRGQTDKVSDYGSEDSRFESWRGRSSFKKNLKYTDPCEALV